MEQRTPSLPQPSSNVLLTPQMICKILSISRRTLRYWVQKQVLPDPLRLGPDGRTLRWHPADLVDYLLRTRGRVGAQAALEELSNEPEAQQRPRQDENLHA